MRRGFTFVDGPRVRRAVRLPWVVPVFLALAVGCSGDPDPDPQVPSGSDSALAEAWAGLDHDAIFGDRTGTFVLVDPTHPEPLVHHPERASTPLPPASTFKVPHTLIALEVGEVDGPDFTLSRDPTMARAEAWWPASWEGEHTLESAFAASVVWYYQEVARRVGADRMTEWLHRLEYGDGRVADAPDHFWLDGTVRTSALDQARFMARLGSGAFAVSEGTEATLRDLMLVEEGPEHRLFGKTGWAGFGDPDAPQIGWFVGYLEGPEGMVSFALNLDLAMPSDAGERVRTAREVLQGLGLIPANPPPRSQ